MKKTNKLYKHKASLNIVKVYLFIFIMIFSLILQNHSLVLAKPSPEATSESPNKEDNYRPGVTMQRREIEYWWAYDKTAICAANSASNQAPSGLTGDGTLPDSVPAPYHDIFIAAGSKNNSPPALVAAIFFAGEHGKSWPDPPPPYGNGRSWETSYANAQGPFQFLPGTWAEYGDDGNGDGKKDIQDLTDGAFGAAKYLASNGGTPGAPDGPRGTPSISNAIWLYNHSQKYVDTVLEAYHTFLNGGTPISGNSTATSAGSEAAPSQSTCSQASNGGGQGIGQDGFVFPLQITKSTLLNNKPPWCYQNQTNCHHDYNAADIFSPTGTIVLAAKPGTVTRTNYSGKFGQNVQIKGDDGYNYYYTHMPQGSNKVNVGDKVTAGQPIGEVGTNANAAGTDHHLHFDITTGNSRPGCSASACPDNVFQEVQPLLISAFNNLPE